MRMPNVVQCDCGEDFDLDRSSSLCTKCKSNFCEKCLRKNICKECRSTEPLSVEEWLFKTLRDEKRVGNIEITYGAWVDGDEEEFKLVIKEALSKARIEGMREANEFIGGIAKLLGEDDLGKDGKSWSVEDFAERIADLKREGAREVLEGMPTGVSSRIRIDENERGLAFVRIENPNATMQDLKEWNAESVGYKLGYQSAVDNYIEWKEDKLKQLNH